KEDQNADGAPIVQVELWRRRGRDLLLAAVEYAGRREVVAAGKGDDQRPRHADARRAKNPGPSGFLTPRAPEPRSEENRDLHPQKKCLDGESAAGIAGLIEFANLACDVAFEEADARNETGDGENEEVLEGHQEMAEHHEDRADNDRPGPADQTVGD